MLIEPDNGMTVPPWGVPHHCNLEVLQYAHEQVCPWDKYTCYNAAENGHLEVFNGFVNRDTYGINGLVRWLQLKVAWRCCHGYMNRDVLGTRILLR